MPKIIGVKFRNVGKVYYFDPGDFTIRYHDNVIVETARGIEYGTVVLSPTEIAEEKVPQQLKSVIRMATEEDTSREKENRAKEKEAYRICKQKIAEHGLEMKLIEAEYTFDNSKVLFYFTADGRIDFRELVKDLAGVFRTRIELRQIGVRDETKLLGGIGSCGRPLCCHTWLTDFAPVSIKMAKDQNLSLNPTKISGTCGRLMCCLKNEADTYAYLNKGLPGKGDYVTTPDGRHGDVQSVNILRQTVKVIVDMDNDEKELQEFDVKDITFIPKSKKPKQQAQPNGRENGRKNRKEESAKGEANGAAKADDPDLVWTPRMDNFETDEDGNGTAKPKRERRRRNPRSGGAVQGEGGENAAENGRAATENGDAEGGARNRRNRKARNHGDAGKVELDGADARTNGGGDAQAGGISENGDTAEGEAVRHRRRRRRTHHKSQREDGANGGAPKEMQASDHYGTSEGE